MANHLYRQAPLAQSAWWQGFTTAACWSRPRPWNGRAMGTASSPASWTGTPMTELCLLQHVHLHPPQLAGGPDEGGQTQSVVVNTIVFCDCYIPDTHENCPTEHIQHMYMYLCCVRGSGSERGLGVTKGVMIPHSFIGQECHVMF